MKQTIGSSLLCILFMGVIFPGQAQRIDTFPLQHKTFCAHGHFYLVTPDQVLEYTQEKPFSCDEMRAAILDGEAISGDTVYYHHIKLNPFAVDRVGLLGSKFWNEPEERFKETWQIVYRETASFWRHLTYLIGFLFVAAFYALSFIVAVRLGSSAEAYANMFFGETRYSSLREMITSVVLVVVSLGWFAWTADWAYFSFQFALDYIFTVVFWVEIIWLFTQIFLRWICWPRNKATRI